MNQEEYEDIRWNNSSWRRSARIAGTLEAALLFYFSYTEIIVKVFHKGFSEFIPLLGGQYFLAIILTVNFIGLIIAYWKEGLGGMISLTSLIVLFLNWLDFHPLPLIAMSLLLLPSVLYVVYWWRVRMAIRRAGQVQGEGS